MKDPPLLQANDKHDVMRYTAHNAPFIGLAGLVAGLQEAFYQFEVGADVQMFVPKGVSAWFRVLNLLHLPCAASSQRMPPAETRHTAYQASKVLSTVGRKTLLGTALGGVFCFTEATVENMRHKHDMINGIAGGAATGLAFGMARPMPQPVAWPLMFAGVSVLADLFGERIPGALQANRWVLKWTGLGKAGFSLGRDVPSAPLLCVLPCAPPVDIY